MSGLNRAAIITALMTLAGTMTSHSVQADSGKQKGMTPPGLEKHHFMSPGQTKKWKKGAFVPADMAIIPCAEWDSLHLAPPPRGAFYGYVDQDLLLIAEAGHEILDTIVLADAAITAVVP